MRVIEAIQLSKNYGSHVALEGINFKVDAGKLLCLLGANGAGKSTTINLFLNFIKPTSGAALVNGIDVSDQPALVRREIMYLPEQMTLYLHFTAVENLAYLASISNIHVNKEVIRAALIEVGLQRAAQDQRLCNYSKGMRQKVGIAFAVLKQAKALLLDEPTSGLDPSATREFIDVIKKLKHSGTAVLMVTHDLYCALSLADEICIMKAGKAHRFLATQSLTLNELESAYFEVMNPVAA